jgi:excisionase family DNA binding protein
VKRTLTVLEAAKVLGCSRRTVYALVANGQIDIEASSHGWRVVSASCAAHLERTGSQRRTAMADDTEGTHTEDVKDPPPPSDQGDGGGNGNAPASEGSEPSGDSKSA